MPEFPPVVIIKDVLGGAIALTAVSYCLSMSLGLTYAKQQYTPIDANQELLAMVRLF